MPTVNGIMVVDNSDLHHGDFEKRAVIIFLCLTPTFIFARFLSRILSKQLGKDDWAALAAFAFTMNCNAVTLAAFPHGWGRHKKNLAKEQVEICLILHYVFQITYKLAVAMNKASILLLYLRIMPQRLYRIAIFTILTIVGLFAVATTIAGVFQCIPVDKAWHKSKPGHCYNLVDAWYTNAVFSIVTDILILLLPMHMVYKLQRDRREKFLLYGVFGLGFFVTFTSIMRFFALKSAKNPDTTYDITSGFWSVIEINVGVICVCLPPLRTLLARQFSFFNSRARIPGSSGPYQKPKSGSNAPSELVTIGGTGGIRSKVKSEREQIESSEEELVLPVFGHGVEGRGRDGDEQLVGVRGDFTILKKTEFQISERRSTDHERVRDIERDFGSRERPWERIPHAT